MYMTFRVDGDNGLLPKRDNDTPGARPCAESFRFRTLELQSASHMPAYSAPSDP